MPSGYSFLVLGCFEFLGGLLNSYLSDRFDKYLLNNFGIGLIEMAFVVTFIAVDSNSYVATFFAAGLFGKICVCFKFSKDLENAFARV